MLQSNLVNQNLLKLFILTALLLLSSCNDDDGNSGPDIGRNSAEASTSGDLELEINSDGPPQVTNIAGALAISWSSGSATVGVGVPAEGTGTFGPEVFVTKDKTTWDAQSGDIEITTNDDKKVIGTLNDHQLWEQSGDRRATLNGAFNASKPPDGGSGTVNQLKLSGAVTDTISFDVTEVTNTADPIPHVQVSLGEGAVKLEIVPQQVIGSLDAVNDSRIFIEEDSPVKRAALTVNYGGNTWTSASKGSVDVATINSDGQIHGKINNVPLKNSTVDGDVTMNGLFIADII